MLSTAIPSCVRFGQLLMRRVTRSGLRIQREGRRRCWRVVPWLAKRALRKESRRAYLFDEEAVLGVWGECVVEGVIGLE